MTDPTPTLNYRPLGSGRPVADPDGPPWRDLVGPPIAFFGTVVATVALAVNAARWRGFPAWCNAAAFAACGVVALAGCVLSIRLLAKNRGVFRFVGLLFLAVNLLALAVMTLCAMMAAHVVVGRGF